MMPYFTISSMIARPQLVTPVAVPLNSANEPDPARKRSLYTRIMLPMPISLRVATLLRSPLRMVDVCVFQMTAVVPRMWAVSISRMLRTKVNLSGVWAMVERHLWFSARKSSKV